MPVLGSVGGRKENSAKPSRREEEQVQIRPMGTCSGQKETILLSVGVRVIILTPVNFITIKKDKCHEAMDNGLLVKKKKHI